MFLVSRRGGPPRKDNEQRQILFTHSFDRRGLPAAATFAGRQLQNDVIAWLFRKRVVRQAGMLQVSNGPDYLKVLS